MVDGHSKRDLLSKPATSPPKDLYGVLFGRLTNVFSFLAIVATFFLPEDGLQIDLCWIQKLLALPCPGCGLTRSITCISHLHFAKSLIYHPFGILIYSMFLANVLLSITPRSFSRGMRNTISRNERLAWMAYSAVVMCFVGFGIARMIWCYFSSGLNHV